MEYFLNIQDDKVKLESAQVLIGRIIQLLPQSSENWKFVIAIGWWKMLESSGMPALIDNVLSEGFSPSDWTIKAVGSSPQLAFDIAQRWGEINEFSEATNFLRKAQLSATSSITLPPLTEREDIQRVKKVLRWGDIREELTECNIKMLAFLWFSFFFLEHDNLLPLSAEYSIKLYDGVWDVFEKLLGKAQQELLYNLESTIKALAEKHIGWALEIFRIPEVV